MFGRFRRVQTGLDMIGPLSKAIFKMASVIASIDRWVTLTPEKICLSFLDDSGSVTDALSYADLQRRISRLAKYLVKDLALTGKNVLLVYPPSLDFIVAFLACIKAGVVPVPVHPPAPDALHTDLHMFSQICKSCGAKVALTSASFNWDTKIAGVKAMFTSKRNNDALSSWPTLTWHVTDPIVLSASHDISDALYAATPESINHVAYLQYTSSSASDPRGAMTTHANLHHNLDLLGSSVSASPDIVVVSWLPHYGDMGLVGSYLCVLHCGGSGLYMSPLSFLKNPPLWVKCVSSYRCTHVQAPHFAYALTAKKFLQTVRTQKPAMKWAEKLDLSCVQHMMVAAEPASRGTEDLFQAVFRPYGLPRKVFFPTYGLAEHTMFVSGSKGGGKGQSGGGVKDLRASRAALQGAGEGEGGKFLPVDADSDAGVPHITLCSCGRPGDSSGVTVVIARTGHGGADEENAWENEPKTVVAEGAVGEVWVSSPSVAAGYYGMQEETARAFHGRVTNDLYKGMQFLRTGDLGFMHKGHLYITGRLKDVASIRGKRHHAQDIEQTAEASTSPESNAYLQPGCSAAFFRPAGERGSGEELCLVAEVSSARLAERREDNSFFHEAVALIRMDIYTKHGIAPSYVALVEPGAAQKTKSGKIDRARVRRLVGTQDKKWTRHIVSEYNTSVYLLGPIVYPSEINYLESEKHTLASFLEDELDDSVAHTVNQRGKASLAVGRPNAIDPTGMPPDDVLRIIITEIKAFLYPGKIINAKHPLSPESTFAQLGIDSMLGTKFLSILKTRFTVSIPAALIVDPDCTLRNIASCLVAGGRARPRPHMITASRLVVDLRDAVKPVLEDKKNPIISDAKYPQGLYNLPVVSSTFLARQSTKANFNTLKFRNGSCSSAPEHTATMVPAEAAFMYNLQSVFLGVGNETLVFCVRILLYVTAFVWLFRWKKWLMKIVILLGLILIDALPHNFLLSDQYINTKNLAVFQASRLLKCLCDFFSFRFIVENPIGADVPTMMLISGIRVNRIDSHTRYFSKTVPALHASICTGMLHVFMRFMHGFELHTYLPTNIQVGPLGYDGKPFWPCRYSFLYKYTSEALVRLGFKGNLNFSEIADTVVDYVYGDNHQGQVPHIALSYDGFEGTSGEMLKEPTDDNIHAIRLALIMGYQVVPCLQMHSNIQGHWEDRNPLNRSTMVMVTGRPIQCPRMVSRGAIDLDPLTEELVAEYHNMYKDEIKRMALQHANVFVRPHA